MCMESLHVDMKTGRVSVETLSHPVFQSRATPSPNSATEWCLAQDQTPSLKSPVSNDWSRRERQGLAPLLQAGQLWKSISTPELPRVLSEGWEQLPHCSASPSARFCSPHSFTAFFAKSISIPPLQKLLNVQISDSASVSQRTQPVSVATENGFRKKTKLGF